MIERFNFYDLYGYLIPGVVLLIVLTVPTLWLGHLNLHSSEWIALIVGVAIAYVLGHVLQTIANTALPSSRDSARQIHKYYSVTLLNPNYSLSSSTRNLINRGVRDHFGLNLEIDTVADEAIGSVRQDAFNLCRHVLSKKNNYSEQFEGMYTMMRGLTIALWLGAAHTTGWALAGLLDNPSNQIVLVTGIERAIHEILVLALIKMLISLIALSVCLYKEPRWLFKRDGVLPGETRRILNITSLCLLLLSLCIGGYLGGTNGLSLPDSGGLLVIVAFYLFASFRFLNAYYFFAELFAKTVWLQFAAQVGIENKMGGAGDSSDHSST